MTRYSPRPREAYAKLSGGIPVGPGHSPLLLVPESWNLAYLSFDFEARLEHPNPMFTSLVSRTVRTSLATGGLASLSSDGTVRDLLRLPAPQFVKLIAEHPVLGHLPMYQAFGQQWVATMFERSALCRVGASEADDDVDVTDLRAADSVLKNLSKR